ncbi:unnamed protein product [Cladocopium goreaui]|uniref:Cytochrome b5 heme-binding domain-containing protein n=1 Tax=Cladocopium goreaui TaxID=2562237 RepID=A0A9P1DMC2_9DINO|nr:unnamed protein product [Cladocopium goreaui]
MTLQPPAPALLVPAVSAPFLRAVPVPRSCSGGRGVKRGLATRRVLEDPMQALLGLGAAWWAVSAAQKALQQRRVDAAEKQRLESLEEPWTAEELKRYDGAMDEEMIFIPKHHPSGDGPILVGCDGLVFNVWRSSHFYAPGCEYHILAGRDAARLLAKNKLEEETEEEAKQELSLAERASLQAWLLKFKSKHEVVGTLDRPNKL